MPLDNWFNHYHSRLEWKEVFCFLPHRCYTSSKILWLTKAMQGVKMITGPGAPVVIEYWQDKEEHFMHKLKQ